jgi:hypothetical protein
MSEQDDRRDRAEHLNYMHNSWQAANDAIITEIIEASTFVFGDGKHIVTLGTKGVKIRRDDNGFEYCTNSMDIYMPLNHMTNNDINLIVQALNDMLIF